VLLRDQRSYEIVQQIGGLSCRLCPDSAWLLEGSFDPFIVPGDQNYLFSRADSERSPESPAPLWEGWTFREWKGLRDAEHWKEVLAVKFQNIQKGSTDRMHTHIALCLMGVEHALFPNSYHKIESHYQTWMRGNPLVHWCPDGPI